MHKIILGLALFAVSFGASAQHRHHDHQHQHRHQQYYRYWSGYNWIVPAIVSGAVVYLATKPEQPVIVEQQVVTNPQYVIIDGVTYEKQYIVVNGVTREVLVRTR